MKKIKKRNSEKKLTIVEARDLINDIIKKTKCCAYVLGISEEFESVEAVYGNTITCAGLADYLKNKSFNRTEFISETEE